MAGQPLDRDPADLLRVELGEMLQSAWRVRLVFVAADRRQTQVLGLSEDCKVVFGLSELVDGGVKLLEACHEGEDALPAGLGCGGSCTLDDEVLAEIEKLVLCGCNVIGKGRERVS